MKITIENLSEFTLSEIAGEPVHCETEEGSPLGIFADNGEWTCAVARSKNLDKEMTIEKVFELILPQLKRALFDWRGPYESVTAAKADKYLLHALGGTIDNKVKE